MKGSNPSMWVLFVQKKRKINRPYIPRPRKYRRLFSEPTYWPRRSRGQYGEENQAGIFEVEGNKSLIPGRSARSLLKKRETKALCLCVANACKRSAGAGSSWWSPKWFHRFFFPLAFVNSQRAQVNRPKVLERMVSGSSPLCSEVFVTSLFFLFQIEDLENSKSFRCEIMKKQPHIISGKSWHNEQIPAIIDHLWNVCGQMGVERYWPADLG